MKFFKYLAVAALALCSMLSPAKAQQMNPVVQDNFQRGNESPLADFGNWTVAPVHSGTAYYPVVQNDVLQASVAGDADNASLWTGITWGPDQFASIIFDKGLEDFDCVKVRADLLHTTYYVLCAGITTPGTLGSTTTFTLSKEVTDVATTLKTFTVSSSNIFGLTGTITLEAQGTTITALYNNAVLGSVTDSSIASGVPGLDMLTAQNLSENTITLFQAGTMSKGNTGVPCGSSGYGLYRTPLVQYAGDAPINQVSASGGYATFWVGLTGKTPVVNEIVTISGVEVDDSDALNNTYQITSVGAPVSGWTPITVQFPSSYSPTISLTTLTKIGLFDEHLQHAISISLTNHIVTVNSPNNFAPNHLVEIQDANNSIYDGTHTVYTSNATSFTYIFSHSDIASETETNAATVMSQATIIEYITQEGQATGNLSCVTSNFQNTVTVHSITQKGPQYTPGQHATYTAQVDIQGPCDGTDPLDECGGDIGGGVACADAGTCGDGGNDYTDDPCMCPTSKFELATTRYHTTGFTPINTWTVYLPPYEETFGTFPDESNCTAATTPPDMFFPDSTWLWKSDGFQIPGVPPNYFLQGGLCYSPTGTQPWICAVLGQGALTNFWGLAASGFGSHCTKRGV